MGASHAQLEMIQAKLFQEQYRKGDLEAAAKSYEAFGKLLRRRTPEPVPESSRD